MNFDGKTALVTGGSSGIGRELVRALATAGCRVLTCGRRETALKAVVDSVPGRVDYHVCDISTEHGRSRLIAWVRSSTDSLDLLFNNAGIQLPLRIDPDLDLTAVELEIATNLVAPIMLSAALAPALEAGNEPCVVNLSSGLAIAPKASAPVYCASKAALSNFSRTLRYQFEPRGIRVVDVITPLVKTPMTEGRNDNALEPQAFVASVLRQLAGKTNEIYVGKTKLLTLVLRLAPNHARDLLRNS